MDGLDEIQERSYFYKSGFDYLKGGALIGIRCIDSSAVAGKILFLDLSGVHRGCALCN